MLGSIYRAGVTIRNEFYDRGIFKSYQSTIPVICVGNATVGGSGKSPVVQYIVGKLLEVGLSPVILSRGYGGNKLGPHLILDKDTALEVGDEPLMHHKEFAGNVPVVVSRKRVAGAKLIEQTKLGDIIVLDDGFQHRALERNVNILLVNSDVDEKLLPFGKGREPLAQALKRADFVASVNRGGEVKASTKESELNFLFKPECFIDAYSEEIVGFNQIKKASALTAIAKPKQFFNMLESLGVELVNKQAFRDHHRFTDKEVEHLFSGELTLIATEKDVVKLKHLVTKPKQLLALRLRVSLPAQQEKRLVDSVLHFCSKIKLKKQATAV